MAEVEISYKGSNIATMNASGTKTLLTEAKYLEDDVTITYARPSAPSGTKNISITQNGVTTEDVTNYASAQITANVPNTYSAGDEGKVVSNSALVAQTSRNIDTNGTYDTTTNNEVVVNVSGGGGISVDDIATNSAPSGAITVNSTSIADGAFRSKPITSIYAPNALTVGRNAFQGTSITNISPTDFPALSNNERIVGFGNMASLVTIKLNVVARNDDGSGPFRYNSNMTNLELPYSSGSWGTGNNWAANCTKLKLVDLGNTKSIGNSSFASCSALRTLILRNSRAVVTSPSWAVGNFGGLFTYATSSKVYVPNALISSYQTASNWSSAYAAGLTFEKIEGSIYELS